MKLTFKQIGLFGLALAVTGVGIAMAAAAALERAGTPLDRLLVTATAIALALGAHLLPALAHRRVAVWLLWLGCLAATLYGHAHFFAAAGSRAGQQRATEVNTGSAAAALRAELEAIQARPLATVAADLAGATTRLAQAQTTLARCERSTPTNCAATRTALTSVKARLEALGVEQAQARQASALREKLARAAEAHDNAQAQAAADPIDAVLAQLTGMPTSVFGVGASIVQALLVEMLAATLWVLAFAPAKAAVTGGAEASTSSQSGSAEEGSRRVGAVAAQRFSATQRSSRGKKGRVVEGGSLPAAPPLALSVEPRFSWTRSWRELWLRIRGRDSPGELTAESPVQSAVRPRAVQAAATSRTTSPRSNPMAWKGGGAACNTS